MLCDVIKLHKGTELGMPLGESADCERIAIVGTHGCQLHWGFLPWREQVCPIVWKEDLSSDWLAMPRGESADIAILGTQGCQLHWGFLPWREQVCPIVWKEDLSSDCTRARS